MSSSRSPGRIALSIGVAHSPENAANPRELIACAEAAMMAAKARGKNQVVVFDDSATERPELAAVRQNLRPIAHLKMLQSVVTKVNRLTDVAEIGMTIANELRMLIDYHNCRVFLRRGDDLVPIAFQGELTAPKEAALDLLATRVGVGFTGHVAETGRPLLLGDASDCDFSIRVEGTDEIEESIIAVPLNYGSRVIGAIVISKLGLNQFDGDDLRLLEVLAGHAAVALENANLYEAQRREAESAHALLEFGRELAAAEGLDRVLELIVDRSARIVGTPHASLWLQDSANGDLVGRAATGYESDRQIVGSRFPAAAINLFTSRLEPYLLAPEEYATLADPPSGGSEAYAIAPLVVDERWGALAVAAPPEQTLGDRELELLGGLARQAKVAIANASCFESLERTFLSARRGAGQRARGAGHVHVVPCALDHANGPPGRRRART